MVLVIAALVVDQVVQHALLRDGRFRNQRVAPFDPPLFTRSQQQKLWTYETLLANDRERLRRDSQFDPELGWVPRPGEARGLFEYDAWGSRAGATPLPAREEIAHLVAAVGCSFVRGDEVQGAEAWPSLVDERRPELRIANFGVGGYGLDQVLLRYRRDVRPLKPDEVWLGILPTAALRNTTQFPPLQHHWGSVIAFKPRFRFGAGDRLELVPNPARSLDDLVRLLADQDALLAAIGESDFWIARMPSAFATRGSSWTHHFATPRLWLSWREGRRHTAQDWLSDPESEASRIFAALVEELAREVGDDGARFRALVLPCNPDLASAVSRGDRYWSAALERIRAAGIDVLDLTDVFLARNAHADETFWAPAGHYSASTNRFVADTIVTRWFDGG